MIIIKGAPSNVMKISKSPFSEFCVYFFPKYLGDPGTPGPPGCAHSELIHFKVYVCTIMISNHSISNKGNFVQKKEIECNVSPKDDKLCIKT